MANEARLWAVMEFKDSILVSAYSYRTRNGEDNVRLVAEQCCGRNGNDYCQVYKSSVWIEAHASLHVNDAAAGAGADPGSDVAFS